MNQADINNQWHSLCNEYDEVKKRYFDASALITKKFSAVFRNPSSSNPTADEFEACESAEQEWNAIKQKMSEFCKMHAG